MIDNLIQRGFLAERKSGLGGTDAAVIAGVSTFKRPLQLFYEKRGELPDLFSKGAENVIRWGKLLEPLIRSHYRRETGRTVRTAAFVRHPLFSFLCGHPDGYVWRVVGMRGKRKIVQRGILEIKTAFFTKRGEWERDGVPSAYYLQAQHYMGISGAEFASFAVLFGGSEFEFFDVARDQRIIDLLFAAEVEFWDRIQRNDPPAPTFDAMGSTLARELFKEVRTSEEKILSQPAAVAKMSQYLRLKDQKKKIDARLDELETWLMFELGTAERAFVPGVARVKWSASSRRSVDHKKLEKQFKRAYAATVTEKPNRRLTVKALSDVSDEGEVLDAVPVDRARRKIQAEEL